MKKICWLCLIVMLACFCGFVGLGEEAPVLSFAASRGSVNGGFVFDLQVTASPAPQADVTIRLKDSRGREYTGLMPAGSRKVSLPIPTEPVEESQALVLSLQPSDGAAAGKKGQFTLQIQPLPKVSFFRRVNVGFTGKKMSVQVSCGNAGAILADNNVFQLRDHTGAVLAEKAWKNPRQNLNFQIDVTPALEGRHDLSVWLGEYCVSPTEFGSMTDASRKVLQSVNTKEPYMAITLDCNWYNSHGLEILDVLDKHGVKCTFFMTGNYLRLFPDTAREIQARGHEIANHSNTHMRQTELGDYTKLREILKPIDEAEKLLGVRPRLFRPPYGSFDKMTTAIARGAGMEVCMWSIDSHDWDVKLQQKPETVISRAKKNAGPGSIVLFHLDGYHTAEILDQVIPYYQEELGLTCVPVTKLIALEGRELPPLPADEPPLILEDGDDMPSAPGAPG